MEDVTGLIGHYAHGNEPSHHVAYIYAYAGDVSDMRLMNMRNNAPKDEITIGSDTWKVFPMISNNPNINIGNSPNPSSGGYAIALRKNA